jgi:hypothetical protein
VSPPDPLETWPTFVYPSESTLNTITASFGRPTVFSPKI